MDRSMDFPDRNLYFYGNEKSCYIRRQKRNEPAILSPLATRP
jgi:hypothetical protein